MKKSRTLRAKIALSTGLLLATLSLVLMVAIGWRSTRDVKEEIGSSLAETAHQMGEQLDAYMWSRAGEIEILSELEALKSARDVGTISALIDRLQESFPSFTWIGLTDGEGKVLAATGDILVGENISQRPVFFEALEERFIGDVHDAVLLSELLPNPTGEPLQFVDISAPVYDQQGVLTGVLAAHLSWDWADEMERDFLGPLKKRRDLEVFIVSGQDHVILLGAEDLIGRSVAFESLDRAGEGETGWRVETWPDGREYLTGYALADGYGSYEGLGWRILVRQAVDTAFLSVRRMQLFILAIGGLLTLLFTWIGWKRSLEIAGPIKEITLAADRLRQGKDVQIPRNQGIEEIESLSDALDQLIRSLTETETALNDLEVESRKDVLTGLMTRSAFKEEVTHAMTHARRRGHLLALLYLDLDGFKKINDTLGHDAGDQLLCEVGTRLQHTVRVEEFVARFGGDEFVMMLHIAGDHPNDSVRVVADRVIGKLNEPLAIEGEIIEIGCSIGGAFWPADHEKLDQVLRLADEALYLSKSKGKNQFTLYSEKE